MTASEINNMSNNERIKQVWYNYINQLFEKNR